MKLASLKNGRDGKLAIVSRDLTRATSAFNIADMAISTGAGLLILDMLLEYRRNKRSAL